jgi:hypothetical protein
MLKTRNNKFFEFLILLSMISLFPKKFFIDFLVELGFFIGEKPIFMKKNPSLCRMERFHGCPNEKICPPAF